MRSDWRMERGLFASGNSGAACCRCGCELDAFARRLGSGLWCPDCYAVQVGEGPADMLSAFEYVQMREGMRELSQGAGEYFRPCEVWGYNAEERFYGFEQATGITDLRAKAADAFRFIESQGLAPDFAEWREDNAGSGPVSRYERDKQAQAIGEAPGR